MRPTSNILRELHLVNFAIKTFIPVVFVSEINCSVTLCYVPYDIKRLTKVFTRLTRDFTSAIQKY